MKIKFRKAKLGSKNMGLLAKVHQVIAQYDAMGYKLTLRQLYYRLVSKNVVENVVKSYDRLSHILTEGRMGGLIDWNSIEDRIRVPNLVYYNDDVEDAINDAHKHFRLDRQADQDNYIELWVEKDAISNILKRKTHHYGIRLMVNRGYSSTTAMYDAYCRIESAIDRGQQAHILYLGDFDPSGKQMVDEDIPGRLNEAFGTNVNVKPIAITMPQIEEHKPPPNPAKLSDPRAKWYIEQFGDTCFEVDALEPDTLHEVIEEEVESLMDMEKFKKILEQEEVDKEELIDLPKAKSRLESANDMLAELNDLLVEEQKKEARKKNVRVRTILTTIDEMING